MIAALEIIAFISTIVWLALNPSFLAAVILLIFISNFSKSYKIFYLRHDIDKLVKELKEKEVLREDFDFDEDL